ncbi:MAG: NAD(P)-dependent glycerol-3-phosphate dehydrogenase [Desulfofustis sp. PB-SRB1]|jgi:glycerol-3-phosphate dehydrogenase (NAD(P)+)|nr:NAD(P)-dependent glycerol-3-phosphate dehydrogenase [Desulfofustis sp. PB-SRB1]MBM1001625.1 NAD(P)-dependent glycerol-3-phosphate dehydrogenase [Desulfofustis sp. PB-SRB1]HBH28782.1 NAD(P)-dependent glycerol-3-phosphate dehydrogenase [Desulfofustis sp.]HBH31546.1 NAD(P)-dependent glycerol-3-phosphate dehydrogenase [Desulfofustis sp.]
MTSLNLSNAERCAVAVIGAGSWGTALALLLGRKNHTVRLWGHNKEHIRVLDRQRVNNRYLPGFTFPDSITVTAELADACTGADVICMVVPSHAFREVFGALISYCRKDAYFVSASKGIETDTSLTMTALMTQMLDCTSAPAPAVLSGPSFAKEVAERLPSAVTLACSAAPHGQFLQRVFSTQRFRVYTSSDVLGVEICGALKNCIALAAGISDGIGYGDNARAAIITRGLVEIRRLGRLLGADEKTFVGLSGLGDLVLTCNGPLSRNRSVGVALGKGEPLDKVLADMNMVAEGVVNTKAFYRLAGQRNIDMPIVTEVYRILYENKSCEAAVEDLLNREQREE